MCLFDEIERMDDGPALYAEPAFIYMNRSTRIAFERIRGVLEAWFSQYPPHEQAEFRARFRSTDDVQHRAAFFELFLHELLLRLGCRVEIHPRPSEATTRCPDFLVEPPDSDCFYLEAVLATNESAEETAARARMNDVYDALNRLESSDFFIGMELAGAPERSPPARQIRAFLAEKLAGLDPNWIAELYQAGDYDAIPRWPYEHEGWRIDFFPIPKSPEARGKPDSRPLAMWDYEACWLDTRIAIRDAILKKAGRYGDMDLPFVIAVNALGLHVDGIDIMEALFGKEGYTFTLTESGPSEPTMTRTPDGVWTSRTGPRYRNVSAVLVMTHLLPWNIPRAKLGLYHNPWTRRPYASVLTCFPQAIPCNNRMEWQEGETLASILGLPLDWPMGGNESD